MSGEIVIQVTAVGWDGADRKKVQSGYRIHDPTLHHYSPMSVLRDNQWNCRISINLGQVGLCAKFLLRSPLDKTSHPAHVSLHSPQIDSSLHRKGIDCI